MTDKIPDRYAPYVVTDLPKLVDVVGHHEPTPFWIVPDMLPGVNLGVAGGEAGKSVGKPHADPHVHDHREVYLCITENRGDVVIEVQMNEDKFQVESPFAILLPKGVRHCFQVLKCDTPNYYVFGIMLPD